MRENEPLEGVEEMIALTDDKLAVDGMEGPSYDVFFVWFGR